jgi:hypothetical protein
MTPSVDYVLFAVAFVLFLVSAFRGPKVELVPLGLALCVLTQLV